jgi:hypothetical protein
MNRLSILLFLSAKKEMKYNLFLCFSYPHHHGTESEEANYSYGQVYTHPEC